MRLEGCTKTENGETHTSQGAEVHSQFSQRLCLFVWEAEKLCQRSSHTHTHIMLWPQDKTSDISSEMI